MLLYISEIYKEKSALLKTTKKYSQRNTSIFQYLNSPRPCIDKHCRKVNLNIALTNIELEQKFNPCIDKHCIEAKTYEFGKFNKDFNVRYFNANRNEIRCNRIMHLWNHLIFCIFMNI